MIDFKKRVLPVAAGAVVLCSLSGIGGAVAAGQIGSPDIKNNSVRSLDIKNNSVRSVDIKDNTVRASDLSTTARDALRGETGATGPTGKDGATGPAGATGAKGAPGQDGVSNLIVGAGYADVWAPNAYGESIETCPEGQYALGGGYSTFGGYPTNGDYDLGGQNRDIQVTVSAPYFKGAYEPVDEAGNFRADQWVVRGYNDGDTEQIVRAWVVCATVAD